VINALKADAADGDGIYKYYDDEEEVYHIGISATYIKAGRIDAEIITLGSDTYDCGFKVDEGSAGFDNNGDPIVTHGAKMYGDGETDPSNYFFVTDAGAAIHVGNAEVYLINNRFVSTVLLQAEVGIQVVNGDIDVNDGDVYANDFINNSDRNYKNDIRYDPKKYEEFFSKLSPASFRLNSEKENGRRHTGFIAQDVEYALYSSGLTLDDFSAVKIKDDDGKDRYYLAYEEFVSLNTHMIQKQQSEINSLKAQIEELKSMIKRS
jgi:hypothetical protein